MKPKKFWDIHILDWTDWEDLYRWPWSFDNKQIEGLYNLVDSEKIIQRKKI